MKTNLVHQKLIRQTPTQNQIQSHNSTDNIIHNNHQHITVTKTQEPTNSLQKVNIIQFKYNNDNNWNTVTLIKRAGKHTGIFPNAQNVKFQDNTIKSVDFDREVQTWKTKIPEPHTETMNSTVNNSNHDNDISDTI